MLVFAVFALAVSAVAGGSNQHYSFSPQVGSGSGSQYSITGEGRITAVRVWEFYSGYIRGFQFRYGPIWSVIAGYRYGTAQEIELFPGESIVQISGTYSHYVQSVVFTTSKGRSLYVGRPAGQSFNMYAANSQAELCFVSGRYHGGITAISGHWAVVPAFNSTQG